MSSALNDTVPSVQNGQFEMREPLVISAGLHIRTVWQSVGKEKLAEER